MDKRVEVSAPMRPNAGQPQSGQANAGQGRPRRSLTPWIILLVVLLLAGGVAWRLHTQNAPTQNGRFNNSAPNVGIATAGPGEVDNEVDALGTVTPLASVTVKTQISGVMQSVNFTEGQMVKQGDFLAQIDDRPYQAALAQAQGTLAKDQALLDQARVDLARYQKLAAQNSIASQNVDTQRALVAQYVGTVMTDKAAVQADQINITYCHITAPVSGVVGLRQVDPGNYVTASDTDGIVVINQLQPISVLYSIPEDNIPALHAAIKGGAPIPVTLYDRAGNNKLAAGTLGTLNNEIDTTTGTLKMRAMFDNADEQLVPNQFVNVDMLVSRLTNILTVPVAALQTGASGPYVYVIDAQNVAHVTNVTMGAQDSNQVQITKGLNNGDRVVIDGIDRLRDGITVVVAGNSPAPTAAATPKRRRKRSSDQQAASAG